LLAPKCICPVDRIHWRAKVSPDPLAAIEGQKRVERNKLNGIRKEGEGMGEENRRERGG